MRQLRAYRDVLEGAYVCVVTTNSNERKAVLAQLDAHRKLVTADASNRAYLGVKNENLVVVLDGDGAFSGEGAVSRFVNDCLANERYPQPAVLVLCGICWGNPQSTQVGQVLVGSTLISANRAVVEPSGQLNIQSKTFESALPHEVISAFAGEGVIAPAVMLSLEQLFTNTEVRDKYLARFSYAHGGEMEGFAIVPSCASKSIPWLVVKGVSDFGGNEFERAHQGTAAAAAAQLLAERLEVLPRGVGFDEDKEEDRRQLMSVIRGHSFELKREFFTETPKLALQVGKALRGLEHVIDFYTASTTIDTRLSMQLARTVRELALNAFEHGNATSVRVSVDTGGVNIDDDGASFLLSDLKDAAQGRGGQLAWRILSRDQMEKNRLVVVSRPSKKWNNSVRFEIENSHPQLQQAKEKCRAVVDLGDEPAIYVHPECNDIYIDIRQVEMMTLALDTVDEFQPLLQAGKRLYVASGDPDIRESIERAFAEEIGSGQLIFLADGSPQASGPFEDV